MSRSPARDRRAIRHPGPPGRGRVAEPRTAVVIGGGIAGLAAATTLAERGVRVTLIEAEAQLGGRVRAWPLPDGRTMSRGFHAFFRQYYTLRDLLRRADPRLERLRPVEDYPLLRHGGPTDSFAGLPTTPPLNLAAFVLRSPTFPLRALPRVDIPSAMELLTTSYPGSHERYDGESAQDFLDRLRFPESARHLALEVFARSFFAHPEDFGAGELIGMFHTYFTGSSEGLLFDVPDDDYDSALWAPLGRYLSALGTELRMETSVREISGGAAGWQVTTDAGSTEADALVLAADPRAARTLIAGLAPIDDGEGHAESRRQWQARAAAGTNAPAFAVLRLWLDGRVDASRPAFLGTSGADLLDNITVLERFEGGARAWGEQHEGSVVELHGYALDPLRDPDLAGSGRRGLDETTVRRRLLASLGEICPETRALPIRHEELLIEDDCGLVGTGPWRDRLTVSTPHPGLVMAGDGLRVDYPIALMERAAVTGVQAANELLAGWGVAGEDIWTVPLTGILAARG